MITLHTVKREGRDIGVGHAVHRLVLERTKAKKVTVIAVIPRMLAKFDAGPRTEVVEADVLLEEE